MLLITEIFHSGEKSQKTLQRTAVAVMLHHKIG